MAFKFGWLILMSIVLGIAAWGIANESNPSGNAMPSQEMLECSQREDRRAIQEAGQTGVLDIDTEACLSRGNWAQQHPEIIGALTGSAVFIVGAIALLLFTLDRIRASSSARP